MSQARESIFREAAIDRLSSPDQLDHLVVVTRPADWIAGAVLGAALAGLLLWGVLGRVPTRVDAAGILVGAGGALSEASAGAGGRLARVNVAVGQSVRRGQPLATLTQADISEAQAAAVAAAGEREAELAQLQTASDSDARAEAASDAARGEAFRQAQAAAETRAAALARQVAQTEPLVRDRLETDAELERLRADLADARQRAADARNGLLLLQADRLQRDERRARDLRAAAFRLAQARREADRLGARLGRESLVTSPIDGRVIEIKLSPGQVAAAGAPVAVLESGEARLQAVIYLPPDEGKTVRPGMPARLEPSTVRREEYGVLLGHVVAVSPFPASPEGMAATLHNPDLAQRFRSRGAPYAAVVQLDPSRQTPSGYRWSSRRGPPEALAAGTLLRAQVETRRQRPIELLLPMIRRIGQDLGG